MKSFFRKMWAGFLCWETKGDVYVLTQLRWVPNWFDRLVQWEADQANRWTS